LRISGCPTVADSLAVIAITAQEWRNRRSALPLKAELLEKLVRTGAIGPLVTDAVLAALAIEHGALLASTDRDFHHISRAAVAQSTQQSGFSAHLQDQQRTRVPCTRREFSKAGVKGRQLSMMMVSQHE
jgi:hypothetical protein